MDTATGSSLMEEFELMKQAKYRVYMQNIDKALKNFEYSSEWADLISALGKLNKVSINFYLFEFFHINRNFHYLQSPFQLAYAS